MQLGKFSPFLSLALHGLVSYYFCFPLSKTRIWIRKQHFANHVRILAELANFLNPKKLCIKIKSFLVENFPCKSMVRFAFCLLKLPNVVLSFLWDSLVVLVYTYRTH